MRPDRLTVVLRPRSTMEAIDLGFTLARTHAAAIARAWLALVLPVMLLLALLEHLVPAGRGFTGLLLWWAKPFYDAVVLLVLSRAVFGETPGPRALAGELRRGAGTVLAALTWRRLSLSRSFLLPVHLLEGLRGRARATRVQVLRPATTGSARTATVVCGWIEIAIFAGLASLLVWFTPALYRDTLFDSLAPGSSHAAMAMWELLYAVAISVVEPFYVAAGFALYLNRRTELEGWDIEVMLRRLAARLPAPAMATTAHEREHAR